MSDNNNNVTVFDWDSEIENEGGDFRLLPPGDYNFTVVDFERASFPGSEKMPPCPQAKFVLEVKNANGEIGRVRDSIFLTSKAEWRLCQFFTSIGQRPKGEKVKMDWSKVLGASGMLKLGHDKRNLNDDGTPKYNAVEKYLEPAQPAPAQATPAKKWTMGQV